MQYLIDYLGSVILGSALVLIMAAGARFFMRVVSVPLPVLIPTVLVLCVVGAYALNNTIDNVYPDIEVNTGTASVEYISGPSPPGPVTLNPGSAAHFTWTFSISGSQVVSFTATATGTDSVTGFPVARAASITTQAMRLLIYGPAASPRYYTVPGTSYVVWDTATWSSKTTADFAEFDAIVIGGSAAGDPAIWNAAVATRNTWGPAVTGNMVLIGSDPEEHYRTDYINQAILFAADEPKPGPGLYVELHDYMPGTATTLALMQYFGTFTVQAATCGDDAHKIAQHPVLDSIGDAELSHWSCTPHAGFLDWPAGFAPLAMDVSPGSLKVYTACDGSIGFVFLIASGVTPICGTPELTKVSSQPGNVVHGDEIFYTISWSNGGIGTMIDLTITDTLPANLLYRAGSLQFWAQPDGAGSPILKSSAWAASLTGPWTDGEPADGSYAPLFLRWVVNRVAPHFTGWIRYGTTVSVTCVTYDASIRNSVSGTMLAVSDQYFSNEAVNPLRMGVTLTKTPSGWSVPNGGELTYTIDCLNYGPVTAFNTVIWDSLPAGALFGKCEGGVSCSFDGDKVVWTMPPMVPIGYFAQLKLTVTVFTGATEVGPNFAMDSYTDEAGTWLPVTISNPVTVAVLNPLLTVTKSADSELVPDGGLVTYTLTVINRGTDTAVNVKLWDTLPAGAVYYACGGGSSCSCNGSLVEFVIPEIPAGESAVVTITASVTGEAGSDVIGPNLAETEYRGTALLTGPNAVSNPVTIRIAPGAPDMTKWAEPPGCVAVGSVIDYAVEWTNVEAGIIRNVILFDTLPPGTFYRSPSVSFFGPDDWLGTPVLSEAAYAASPAGPWTVGEPPDGTGAPLFLRWTVNRTYPGNSAKITYSVRVSATLNDGDTFSNAVYATESFSSTAYHSTGAVSCVTNARLILTLTPDGWCVPLGGSLAYTIWCANTGSDTATSISLWDSLPAGAGYVTCSGGSSCSPSGGVVSWSLPDLPPGTSVAVTFTVNVPNATPEIGPDVAEAAYLNSIGVAPPHASSNPVTVPVCPGSPVMDKLASPVRAPAGAVLTYTVAWSNTSPGRAQEITVTDTLPAGTRYLSPSLEFFAQDDALGTPGLVSSAWATSTLGPWNPGEPPDGTGPPLILRWVVDRISQDKSGYVRFQARTDGALADGTVVRNAASATMALDGTPRPTPPAVTTIVQALLQASKSAPAAVSQGGRVPFVITVRNVGADTATAVRIWDTVPANSDYFSCEGGTGCNPAGALVIWNIPAIPPGSEVSVTMYVDAVGPGFVISNTARAGYSNSTPALRPEVNSNTVNVNISNAKIEISKRAVQNPVCEGGAVTFNLSLTNTGANLAKQVTVWDTPPANLTYSSCSGAPCSFDGAKVVFTLPDMASGAAANLTISGVATGPMAANTAKASYTDNLGTWQPFASATAPVVAVVKPLLGLTINRSPAVASSGQNVTYWITCQNSGTASAVSTVLTAPLPAGAAWVSGGTLAGGSVTWNLGAVPPGDSASATLVMRPPATCNPLNMTLTASAAYSDICGKAAAPASAIAPGVQVVNALITLVKTADKSIVRKKGERITYTVTYRNACQQTLNNVVFWDTVPAGTDYYSCTGGLACLEAAPRIIRWFVIPDTLNPGETGQLKMTVVVTGDAIDPNVAAASATSALTLENLAAVSNPVKVTFYKPPAVTAESPCNVPFRVFPNPYDPKKAVRGTLKFEGLPADAAVRIYTVRGLLVWSGKADGRCSAEWNGRNDAGRTVAPGVFHWLVETKEGRKLGQVIVK